MTSFLCFNVLYTIYLIANHLICVVLPSPTNLQISSISATSVNLTWNYPTETVVDGFNISYTFTINECDDAEESANVFISDSSLRSYNVSNSSATPVEEDSRYTFFIVAVNGTSVSEPSNSAPHTTLSAGN